MTPSVLFIINKTKANSSISALILVPIIFVLPLISKQFKQILSYDEDMNFYNSIFGTNTMVYSFGTYYLLKKAWNSVLVPQFTFKLNIAYLIIGSFFYAFVFLFDIDRKVKFELTSFIYIILYALYIPLYLFFSRFDVAH